MGPPDSRDQNVSQIRTSSNQGLARPLVCLSVSGSTLGKLNIGLELNSIHPVNSGTQDFSVGSFSFQIKITLCNPGSCWCKRTDLASDFLQVALILFSVLINTNYPRISQPNLNTLTTPVIATLGPSDVVNSWAVHKEKRAKKIIPIPALMCTL